MQDTLKIKERIISIINSEGPNFPSPIASRIQTSILFTSAFLSELLSEKKLKITNMKVGSSPIYHIPGQEEKLEPFAIKYLKSKEKDAFILLKEKNILKDKEQEPAIRVALRSIRDFAFPLEKNNELYWRYFLSKEESPKHEENIIEEKPKIPEKIIEQEDKKPEKPIEILDKEKSPIEKIKKPEEKKIKKKTSNKKTTKKSTTKKDEKFFEKIKEYLSEKKIEILDIKGLNKDYLTLKVKSENEEYLLVAYNKKRISEKEIIETSKKAEEENLKYEILSLSEPSKKLTGLIEALKKIKEIKKIN